MPCPRVARCAASCFHRELVESYWAAREVWEQQRERDAIGYATEMREFAELNPPPLFKRWLIDSKGRNEQPQEWGAVA
jgi:hypothetical protein